VPLLYKYGRPRRGGAECQCRVTRVFLDDKGRVWEIGRSVTTMASPGPRMMSARECFDNERVQMVSAGSAHTCCVTVSGVVWTWGLGQRGLPVHGAATGADDDEIPRRPDKLALYVFGGVPTVMVACGRDFTLVLTTRGKVWSFGKNTDGHLGVGDFEVKSQIAQVGDARFQASTVVMVAAGTAHIIAVDDRGAVYTWVYIYIYVVPPSIAHCFKVRDRGQAKACALGGMMFAFAVENSYETAYVTEKLWEALRTGAIPVYSVGPIAENRLFLPHPDAGLIVEDFASMAELGAYMRIIARTPALWHKHAMAWRSLPLANISERFLWAVEHSFVTMPCWLCEWWVAQNTSRAL